MQISELARIAKVTKRTLHYYDQIGLLTPEQIDENGYRIYSEQNRNDLQQILFFRQLEMPLKEIKEMMQNPSYDAKKALYVHKQILLQKRRNLDKLMQTIDDTIEYMEGMRKMSDKDKFIGFDFTKNKYEEEARKLYGDQAVEKAKKLARPDFGERMNTHFFAFASLRELDVHEELVQKKMAEWYYFLNEMGITSYEAFAGLGQLYISDQRFTENIDQFGDGLAAWLAEAMAVFAEEAK